MALQRTDDLNGSPAEQVTFGLDGTAYVLDLGNENHERLRQMLRPFLTVAAPIGQLPTPPLYPVPDGHDADRAGGADGVVLAMPSRRISALNSPWPHKVVRAWVMVHHPELNVRVKGRLPDVAFELYATEGPDARAEQPEEQAQQ